MQLAMLLAFRVKRAGGRAAIFGYTNGPPKGSIFQPQPGQN
jgi:hypothetical protein